MRVAILLLGALALGGCSMTLPPIQHQSSDGSGTLSGNTSGSGAPSIAGDKGL
jgi:hypothetical protein